ncbi:MBL fold metallo-hydrolase [Bacillus ndiopicus]|uniref:MBL fold metallo-hydrolase n=1 Tax=Bacillus ndiopicus TaxID=1347368 RepID=UPI0005A9C3C6|nr:MBL fold metallo-hydrolase [Bacillus ndiopicus]
MLNVEILGGVGEYGRNCFFIEVNNQAILLDCGIMKNKQKTLPNLSTAHVEKLTAIFISHSHIDHVGALPFAEQLGYKGPIIMSAMTRQQLKRPYANTLVFPEEPSEEWITVSEKLAFQWGYSGHVIGSVWYKIRFEDKMIFYSGDYVVDSYVLRATLPQENEVYDVAFIDSGHVELHVQNKIVLQQIAEFVQEHSHHPIIFPSSFSGKTLDIATYLSQHTTREIYVDKQLQPLFQQYMETESNVQLENAAREVFWLPMKDVDTGLYFVAEQNAELYPQALPIYTGYLHREGQMDRAYQHFFYKTHPDYEDILQLSKQIRAKEIIYFHSPYPLNK